MRLLMLLTQLCTATSKACNEKNEIETALERCPPSQIGRGLQSLGTLLPSYVKNQIEIYKF